MTPPSTDHAGVRAGGGGGGGGGVRFHIMFLFICTCRSLHSYNYVLGLRKIISKEYEKKHGHT